MDDVLRKVRALHVTNSEIIERIQSREEDECTWFTYEVRWNDDHNNVEILEYSHSLPTKMLLRGWSKENKIESVLWRLSEDRPDWNSSTLTWESAKQMNTDLIQEVEKLAALLDPNPHNPSPGIELRKYLRNYENLQVALGSLEEGTMSQPSRLEQLREQAAIAPIDQEIRQIGRDVPHRIDSTILSVMEYYRLKTWYCPCSTGSSLRLLYRASRDGLATSTFHRLCDNQGPTITVIRSSKGFVFGGYTTATWEGNWCVGCDQTSLFTLRNPQDVPPRRFHLERRGESICTSPSSGPTFGVGHDICTGTSGTIGHAAYTQSYSFGQFRFTEEPNFSIADLEVFLVVV